MGHLTPQANDSMSRHQVGQVQGVGQYQLYYQSWHPQKEETQGEETPVATLVLVHGLGSHSSLFMRLVDYLLAQRYCVYSFDLPGHGRSSGQRGFIQSWSDFRDSLHQLMEQVAVREAGRPCFLLGHSLGGAIALDYALRFPEEIQGLILSAPALGTQGISSLKLWMGRLLSRLWPRFSLNTGLRRYSPSRDPQVNQAYATDPLRHSRGTARLSTEFARTLDWIHQHLNHLAQPILILQGGADPVARLQNSQTFFERLSQDDKTWRAYPEAYHELFNDLDTEQVLADVLVWLAQHQTPCRSRSCRVS